MLYEFGNKSGKLQARALQSRKATNTIHTIRDPSGTSFVSSEDIANQFVQYFSNLYNLPSSTETGNTPERQAAIRDFLTQYCPSSIAPEDAASLDLPISTDEITAVLKQLRTGKSPGPDGLTVSYYKTFHDILTPHLTTTFNALSSSSQVNKDLLEAHITLILKPGKDETLVSNYRPISLLNVDMSIYAKILANRILHFLPKLISLDKVGFIPGGEARDNTIKAINIHHWLLTSSKQGFFLSLDTEKAFDRVAWDYMVAVLQAMGFPAHFLQWILALYASTTARIRVNGPLSDAFSVSDGT